MKKANTTTTAAKAAKPVAKKCATKKAPCAAKKEATKKTPPTIFTASASVGDKVAVSGTFNNWDPTGIEMKDVNNDGTFTVAIDLQPGEYQYKFIINGTWCPDTANPSWTKNDFGTLNSIVNV